MISCKFENCKKKIHPLLGICKHCNITYCTKHFSIFSHNCEKKDEIIAVKKEKMIESIMMNKCINDKIKHI